MEATCNHCNHWQTETAAAAKHPQGFGECNELSHPKAEMHYILPVLQNGDPRSVEYITGADFGCNHFQATGEA